MRKQSMGAKRKVFKGTVHAQTFTRKAGAQAKAGRHTQKNLDELAKGKREEALTMMTRKGKLRAMVMASGMASSVGATSGKQYIREMMAVKKRERTLQHGIYAYEHHFHRTEFFKRFDMYQV